MVPKPFLYGPNTLPVWSLNPRRGYVSLMCVVLQLELPPTKKKPQITRKIIKNGNSKTVQVSPAPARPRPRPQSFCRPHHW